MANIVNCTQDHVRLLTASKNHHLDVTRIYPMGVPAKRCLQPEGSERDLNGALVQPVRSVITNCPDMEAFDTAYIVDMDVAVSLAERGGRACLLVPCDPFLVPDLPHFTDTYAGVYDTLFGSLATSEDVRTRLSEGYKIYGYRRLLMVYAGDSTQDSFVELAATPRANEDTDQERLRKALQEYQELHKKRIGSRLSAFRTLQSCVDVADTDEVTQTFPLTDAGVSRLLLYLDYLLQY